MRLKNKDVTVNNSYNNNSVNRTTSSSKWLPKNQIAKNVAKKMKTTNHILRDPNQTILLSKVASKLYLEPKNNK